MSPRTKEQCEELREKRTKQILEAAEKVFLEKGTQFDIRDVAKKAELGYGTVYHYYSNKQVLLQDLLEQGFAHAAELTEHVFTAEEESPMKQLEVYCQALQRAWSAHTSTFLVYKIAAENFCGLEEAYRQEKTIQFQQALYRPLVECLQRAAEANEISRALGAEKLANGLLGSMIGSYGIYLYHHESTSDPSFVTELLLQGLRGQGGNNS